MSAAARPAAQDDGATLAVPGARGLAFVLLCGVAALQWNQFLEPREGERAVYALLVAGFAMLGLLAAGRAPARLRRPLALFVAAAALPLALLGGGIADELLRPDLWGELAAGIGRGISSLPGARVPYRGFDEWTRTVLSLGGTMLALAAALAAFWPRRDGLGSRNVSLVLLVALYAIPAVALDFGASFLSGALLAVLVVTYLRLERVRITDAGAAGALAVATTILGLAAAPVLDGDEPWFDYETWALSSASSRTTAFSWEHSYDPLDWPRDGREMLRVKARLPAYWKAANLDHFDGDRWVRDRAPANVDGCVSAGYDPVDSERWLQEISVSVRNLRSQTFITAGVACDVEARLTGMPRGDGTYSTMTRVLRRGDAYRATVYTPQPTERERRAHDGFYPYALQRFTRIELPVRSRVPGIEPTAQFPVMGVPDEPVATLAAERGGIMRVPAAPLLKRSAYRRTWALAQRFKRQARGSQEDYVQAVERHLRGDEFSYTEVPPESARDLEGFLFEAKAGYCQQYSGAMALLLRMGGVPARVSTGFTSGSYDRKAGEYVVRDLDAHSWVEVWYPGIGWVTRDPTPASAPPRSQPDEETAAGSPALQGAPDLGGDVRTDVARRSQLTGAGTPWGRIALAALAAVALLALGAWLRRRHHRRVAAGWGPLAELERALVRARRDPGPAATLRTVERAFSGSPAAAGYVRALCDQRYAARPQPPPASGRRAVRAELARGAGLAGRLRAWWALPPRPR